jgi:hypothetical protein
MAPPPRLSVEQYAGIRAALAEGHPLEQVLAQEGVPAWRWPELDLALAEELTHDARAFARYAEKLGEAEDVLERKVAPLDDDLAAWTGFVSALAAAGPSLLDDHGLRPSDLARLQRRWQRRFADDEGLRERAAELAKSPARPPAAIDAGAAELRPFPWTPGAEAAQAGSRLEPLAFLAATKRASPGSDRRAPPLPFSGSRPPPPGNLALEPSPELGDTAPADRGRAPSRATPFEPEIGVPAAPVAAPPPAPRRVEPPRAPLEPEQALAATASARTPSSPALPFAGARPAPPRAASALEPHPALGQTAPLGARAPAAVAPPPPRSLEPIAGLAATAPLAEAPEAWTADDYAAFRSELDAANADRRAVLARWRVAGEPAVAALERRWRERFAADPASRDRFVAALRVAVTTPPAPKV